jgi:hypothetical protein
MKKLFFSLLIAAAVAGCSKSSDTNPEKVTNKLPSLAKEVLAQPSVPTMKQAYRLLTSEERYALWDMKLATILKNDNAGFTNEQRSIVLEFQDLLRNGIIKKMAADLDADALVRHRMPIYQKAFTKKQLYFLMESPYFTDDFSVVNIEQNGALPDFVIEEEGLKNCECRLDIYCYLGTNGGGRCSEKGCKKTSGGCGFLGGSECLGKCVSD